MISKTTYITKHITYVSIKTFTFSRDFLCLKIYNNTFLPWICNASFPCHVCLCVLIIFVIKEFTFKWHSNWHQKHEERRLEEKYIMDGFSPLNLMKNKRQYITKSKNLPKRTQKLLKAKNQYLSTKWKKFSLIRLSIVNYSFIMGGRISLLWKTTEYFILQWRIFPNVSSPGVVAINYYAFPN